MNKVRYINVKDTGLPGWAVGIIAVTLVGGAAFIAYKVYKKLTEGQGGATTETEGVKAVLDEVQKELKNETKKGEVLSKPLSAYKSAANTIFQKLDGCDSIQAETEAIVTVINVVDKKIDWLELQNAFGRRKVDNCGIGTGETEYDLATLLKEQLDGSPRAIATKKFVYNSAKSGVRTGADILNLYLSKIGVTL